MYCAAVDRVKDIQLDWPVDRLSDHRTICVKICASTFFPVQSRRNTSIHLVLFFMGTPRRKGHALDLVIAANLISQRLQAKRKEWELNVTQMLVLEVTSRSYDGAGMTPSAIATELGMERATVSAQMTKLEQCGLLEVVIDPAADQRERIFRLSARAASRADAVCGLLEDVDRLMRGILGYGPAQEARRAAALLVRELPNCPPLIHRGSALAFQEAKQRERRRATVADRRARQVAGETSS